MAQPQHRNDAAISQGMHARRLGSVWPSLAESSRLRSAPELEMLALARAGMSCQFKKFNDQFPAHVNCQQLKRREILRKDTQARVMAFFSVSGATLVHHPVFVPCFFNFRPNCLLTQVIPRNFSKNNSND